MQPLTRSVTECLPFVCIVIWCKRLYRGLALPKGYNYRVVIPDSTEIGRYAASAACNEGVR